jgi:hypothetical protein
MNGRKLEQPLVQFAVATLICALSACAHAPAAREQMSILDALDSQQQPSAVPTSCAARNATFVCEKSTRLDPGRSCRCVDPRAFDSGGGAFRL